MGGVIVEYQLRKVIRPIALVFRGKSVQQVIHGLVELFTLPISLWVVWSSAGLPDTIQVTELLDQDTLKIPALV